MKKQLIGLGVAALIFGGVVSAGATPILETNAGKLIGASGVEVNGALYNVSFVEGSCVDLYGGCVENSYFTFQTQSLAIQASQALLDQVFIDVYDQYPDLTYGIENEWKGMIFTPWQVQPPSGVALAFAINYSTASGTADSTTLGGTGSAISTTDFDLFTYAQWESAAPVPEPATMLLFGTGLIGLVGSRLRKKKK